MNSGGRIPPALQSKVDDYWSNYQEAHKGIDIKPFEHQMGLFLKGLKQAPDGRYIAHVDTHINLHSAELQADPRIKWVNDKGEEVTLPGVDVEEPSSYAVAESAPPPVPGAGLSKSAQIFAKQAPSVEPAVEEPPPFVGLGLEEAESEKALDLLGTGEAKQPEGFRALGRESFPTRFKVGNSEYQSLVEFDSAANAKKMAARLSKEIKSGFGVVQLIDIMDGSEHFVILAPDQMPVLKGQLGEKPRFDVKIIE